MQSEVFETDKNSLSNSNVVTEMDAGLSAQPENVVPIEDYQNLIENDEDLENNFSDSDDDQFINSFSSPSNSGDEELRWYAYRGRLGINFMERNDAPNNQFNYPLQNENHQANNPNIQQNQQEEEETDFLEMDFEPDTNSEIENDNDGRFNLNYDIRNGHNNLPENQQQQLPSRNHLNFNINQQSLNELENQNHNISIRNTGAKPKQFSSSRNLKSPKQNLQQVSDGDNTFKITGHLYPESSSSSKLQQKDDDAYNIGASCSRYSLNSERPYHRPNNLDINYLKPHKSPSKSSSHNHKQQRLHEEQNDQFLFEIEPIKPRNSVTIYTSNCDEKILMDALTSLKLKPDREIILNYFNKSKMVPQLGLIDYIIYRSKKNCNYLKIIEIIENACANDYHDEYGTKRFDINFYPLDFFSTTPEMIDIEVSEIIKRWNPQIDLSPLVNIKNKYFIQTNVLGKLVYIIRRLNNNQKPPTAIFREDETIKIPQFYVSGYITITTRHPT